MKPAINSEPASLPELPTNGVEPNPHPVPMTFLPVFPWPSNMPSKNDIYAMFPRSGSNEFWPRPRVDDRMSHFPMPGQPLPGSNYNNVQQTQRQVPSGTGGTVNQAPVTPPAWVRHALSTISTVSTTPSTTTVPSTTMTTTAPTTTTTASEAESNHIWDSTELLKQPTFPEVVPSLSFSSDSDENSVERESEPETTTTTTVATTTRRFVPRYTKIKRPAATLSTKYDFLNNRKVKGYFLLFKTGQIEK
uniref:Salivary glue protein Sgs-3-like n=1 Tax=Panagrellus redivivus TaxID=6233 RepID=A0A7E4UUY1_PANRE